MQRRKIGGVFTTWLGFFLAALIQREAVSGTGNLYQSFPATFSRLLLLHSTAGVRAVMPGLVKVL
jgi:hypothetical protein